MNADSDIYFTHANALCSEFFFGVRNVGIASNELVLASVLWCKIRPQEDA